MPALAGLALLDLADKQPAAAKARFEAVLARHPDHGGALVALAELASRTGAPASEAVQLLERAIKSEPTNPAPRLLLVDQYLAAHQLKPALNAAQAAVTALPDNADLLDRLGRLHLMTSDAQQAISSFNKLAGLLPKSPMPQLRLADAQTAAGNAKAVAAAVRRAGELAPDAVPVQQALARLALVDGKPEQALAIARTLQAKHPDDAVGYLLEGDVESRRRQWDAAAAALRKALGRKQPGDSLQRLHAALVAGGKTAEADKLATDWRKAHPDDMALVLHLGDMALGRGDLPGAEQLYRSVLAQQPADVTSLNNLAFVLASQKKAGGVALMDKALALAPDSPALLDTMALCLAAEQQLPRALEFQAKAIAAAPGALQFKLQMAKLQLQAGDKAQARVELDKLAKLGASYPRQAEVAELLKSIGG
jgi:putative PEP-CTERM system TPR-repeat lipoprotein